MFLEVGVCFGGSIYNNCFFVFIVVRDGVVVILKEFLSYGVEVNVKVKLLVWVLNIVLCFGFFYLVVVYGYFDCFRLFLFYGVDFDYNCID